MSQNGFDLRTFLRTRIKRERKTAESLAFMARVKERYPYLDLEHVCGAEFKKKINDFLLAPIPHEIHMKIESGVHVDGYSFEENLLRAIEVLIEDNKYLYNKLKDRG
jgi:hypothetical protein